METALNEDSRLPKDELIASYGKRRLQRCHYCNYNSLTYSKVSSQFFNLCFQHLKDNRKLHFAHCTLHTHTQRTTHSIIYNIQWHTFESQPIEKYIQIHLHISIVIGFYGIAKKAIHVYTKITEWLYLVDNFMGRKKKRNTSAEMSTNIRINVKFDTKSIVNKCVFWNYCHRESRSERATSQTIQLLCAVSLCVCVQNQIPSR